MFNDKSKNVIFSQITISVIIFVLLGFLKNLFSDAFDAFFIVLRYYLFPFFTKYLLTTGIIIISISLLIFLIKKKHKFKRLKFFCLALTLLISTVILIVVSFGPKDRSCQREQIIAFYFPEFITKTLNGFYTSDTIPNQEMKNGFGKTFNENSLKINNLLLGDDKLFVHEVDIPKFAFDYYSVKKMSLEELFLNYKECFGLIYWFETSEDGSILDIGSVNKFPVIIYGSDIEGYFQVEKRINRLANLGLLSNFAKGVYLGKLYRAILEHSFYSEYKINEHYDIALAMIENTYDEFLSLDKFLREKIEFLQDDDARRKALIYLEEDLNTWLFYLNGRRVEIYEAKRDYAKAEVYLKKMFENNLYLNKTDYKTYLKTFQKRYFIKKSSISEQDIKRRFTKAGFSSVFYPEEYNGLGLFMLLDYSRCNDNFDFEKFYQWLIDLYPNDPVVYMFWGKTYTSKSDYSLGAERYKKALEIFPESPMLKVLYETAIYNDAINNGIDEEQKRQAKERFAEEIEKLLSLPELVGVTLNPNPGESISGPCNW